MEIEPFVIIQTKYFLKKDIRPYLGRWLDRDSTVNELGSPPAILVYSALRNICLSGLSGKRGWSKKGIEYGLKWAWRRQFDRDLYKCACNDLISDLAERGFLVDRDNQQIGPDIDRKQQFYFSSDPSVHAQIYHHLVFLGENAGVPEKDWFIFRLKAEKLLGVR